MFAKRLLKVAVPIVGLGISAKAEKQPKVVYAQSADYCSMSSVFFKSYLVAECLPIGKPHPVRPVFEQNLAEWAENSTKKFQLLDFTPADLAIEVAFLRLLGVEKVSLEDLGRERGSMGCFVSHLPIVEGAHPVIITSLEDVLSSIDELNANSGHRHLKSLYAGVSDPIAHIKPPIVDSVNIVLNSHALEAFYKKVSLLSDNEIMVLTHQFLTNDKNPHHLQVLSDNLKKARIACQDYITSLEQEEQSTHRP